MPTAGALVLAWMLAALQGGVPRADPITGAWSADGETLLELRLEGDRVYGTVYLVVGDFRSRAPVAEGRFDATARSLALRGEIPGPEGTTIRYAIDATLDGDALDTVYDFGGNRGKIQLVRTSPR